MNPELLDDILWRHLSHLPYFRGFLRAVEDLFYQQIDLREPVLDLGSGDGHFASVAFSKKPEVGLDPSYDLMNEAKSRGAYQLLSLGEGAHIPFSDQSFATVVSISVLEHIPDIQPVLDEVSRVLQHGGQFIFCVPNHRFPQKLWGRGFLMKIGLSKLAEAYSTFFNRIARHAHTDSPAKWRERLNLADFEVLETWDYFPPKALHILEWGHPLGIPALVSKKIFGRWILLPTRWNLAIPWKMTRKFLDNPKSEEGVCSFFVARKKPWGC